MSNLNKEQARAVNKIFGPCLVLAGPGSGKTFTIVERIRHMIEEEDIPPSQILVITFSTKSAQEMKHRFFRVSGDKNYPVYFGTFHSVYYSIVRNYYHLSKDSVLSDNDKLKIINFIFKKNNIENKDASYKQELIKNFSAYKIIKNNLKIHSAANHSLFIGTKNTNNIIVKKESENIVKEKAINDNKGINEKYNEMNEIDNKSDDEKFLMTIEDKEEFLKLYEEFSSYCKKERKIDFDDMLFICRDLLHNNNELLTYYKNIYKYILVDEFQDINDVQYDILMLLAGNERNLFVVGDDDQAIYGFRGSKPEYMQQFVNDNNDCEIINLTKNYRCAECVIDNAITLIKNNINRMSKVQYAGKKDKDYGQVVIESFLNEGKEAEYILCKLNEIFDKQYEIRKPNQDNYGIQEIRGAKGNNNNNKNNKNNVAIIYRTSRCAGLIKELLTINGYKINDSSVNTYYQAEWIKDVINYIKLSIDYNRIYHQLSSDKNIFNCLKQLAVSNGKLLFDILNKPDRGVTRDYISLGIITETIKKLAKDFMTISTLNPFGAIHYIFKVVGYEQYYYDAGLKKGLDIEQLDNQLEELLQHAKVYKTNMEWIKSIELINRNDVTNNIYIDKQGEHNKEIHMLTAHASKGLEFDTVFVIGLQEGIFPHRKALSKEQIEEERRLLYVAMTRAKTNLYILGRGAEKNGKKISRFLAEIQTN